MTQGRRISKQGARDGLLDPSGTYAAATAWPGGPLPLRRPPSRSDSGESTSATFGVSGRIRRCWIHAKAAAICRWRTLSKRKPASPSWMPDTPPEPRILALDLAECGAGEPRLGGALVPKQCSGARCISWVAD